MVTIIENPPVQHTVVLNREEWRYTLAAAAQCASRRRGYDIVQLWIDVDKCAVEISAMDPFRKIYFTASVGCRKIRLDRAEDKLIEINARDAERLAEPNVGHGELEQLAITSSHVYALIGGVTQEAPRASCYAQPSVWGGGIRTSIRYLQKQKVQPPSEACGVKGYQIEVLSKVASLLGPVIPRPESHVPKEFAWGITWRLTYGDGLVYTYDLTPEEKVKPIPAVPPRVQARVKMVTRPPLGAV